MKNSERIDKLEKEGRLTTDEAAMLRREKQGHQGEGKVVLFALFLIVTLIGLIYSLPSSTEEQQSPQGNSTEKIRNRRIPQVDTTIYTMPSDTTCTQGELIFMDGTAKKLLPLQFTDVNADITGNLARVTLTQTFINPLSKPIEAVYTFPLSDKGAVDSMIMFIGNRRIEGEIKEKEEAKALYKAAKAQGKTAALLEQQRPNIFTQSIANILPGDTIDITISYVEEVSFLGGKYSFHVPMTVGPRFTPGTGNSLVPDASKVTPPTLKAGTRNGNRVALSVKLNSGKAVKAIQSPSHRISMSQQGTTADIAIIESEQLPNKDFILTYKPLEPTITPTLLAHRSDESDRGHFLLTLLPQMNVEEEEVMPRELVFVIDNSGSMNGFPLNKCKEVIRRSLEGMRSEDKFRLMTFAGSVALFDSKARKNSQKNIDEAFAFLNNRRGGGGTQMMKALEELYRLPDTPKRKRIILFLTDGFVSNEGALIAAARDSLRDARLFTLGVSSSPNAYLLRSMAKAGGGIYRHIRQDGNADKTTNEFYSLIDKPVLTDITIRAKGVSLHQLAPAKIPDLYSGQPLNISGTYAGSFGGTLIIEGNLPGGKRYKKRLSLSPHEGNSIIRTLWARNRIADRELSAVSQHHNRSWVPNEIKAEITKLALQYKIMSQYTSFVAVDKTARNESGEQITINQPVELAEGSFGSSYAGGGRGCQTAQYSRTAGGSIGYSSGTGSGFGGGSRMKNKIVLSQLSSSMQNSNGARGSQTVKMQKEKTAKTSQAPITEADPFGKGGYAKGIDAILSGSTGVSKNEELKKKKKRLHPGKVKQTAMTGDRSESIIMRTIRFNMASLKYAYNKRLRMKPGFKGKIVVKWSINEFGSVLHCTIVSSTMNDPVFEKTIVEKIKKWDFGKIDIPGDVTEVTYPFVFTE